MDAKSAPFMPARTCCCHCASLPRARILKERVHQCVGLQLPHDEFEEASHHIAYAPDVPAVHLRYNYIFPISIGCSIMCNVCIRSYMILSKVHVSGEAVHRRCGSTCV